ncbi:MAG TPA: gluconate 2-dehydrogenase subunit 3 family protein [Bryobacteraceae bacterium]|nr:gluconate 2-dehydrogenase subunit 3 family protein [Bryobacteraceae bacterium]
MANQGPDRRTILQMLSVAAVASQFPGFSRWAYAEEVQTAPRPAAYKPQFFSSAEYGLLDRLTEMIIPRDETPGARDAGVSEFIDFMVAHDPDIQQPFRSGLRSLQEGNLSPERLLAAPFFKLLRRYTVMGFYTTRIGLEQLDFPGLKMYSKSPGCPHTNDREHKHLQVLPSRDQRERS